MRFAMEQRHSSQIQDLDARSIKYLSISYAPTPYVRAPIAPGVSSSGPSILSPVVVAMVVVLAGAFLIVSYYRVFDKYCNRNLFCFWSAWRTGRDGSPSTIVLMEEHGASRVGLDDALISRIPTRNYDPHEGVLDKTECSVCLGEFEVGEVLRILPKCNHPFHIPCIDTWLVKSSTCPLCRINIALEAALPHTLMPAERETPAHARGPTMSLILASNTNPGQALINHENEILHENVLELLEIGQFSGPSRSMSPPSSGGSFIFASDVGIQDNEQIEMEPNSLQHSRHLSLEAVATPMRETHLLNRQNITLERNTHLSRQLSVSMKRRLYYHAHREVHRLQSEGGPPHSQTDQDLKGKHPLVPFPAPQMKRFVPLIGSSSARSTSSSSDQEVAELLTQEIFSHTSHFKIDSESILRTRSKKQPCSMEKSQEMALSTYSSHKSQQILQDDASFETMRSNKEQGNPLSEFSKQGTCVYNTPDDSTGEGVYLQFFLAVSSDDEDENLQQNGQLRSDESCKDHCQMLPSEACPFKTSMSRLNSCESLKKAHTSEPVFEVFNF